MEIVQEKIRSLWVPLRDMNLLLPNVAVAEIGSYRKPSGIEGAPEWLLGNVKWRGREIPVISLESLCGMSVASNPVFSRLMMVNSVHPDSTLSHYAIVTAGLPGLIQFDTDTASDCQPGEQRAIRCVVQIGSEQAVIPDLDYLQSLLEQQFEQAA
jgi:chemosensory pili system protein ChpC